MSIPTAIRVPIFAIEYDSSRAFVGASALAYTALLVGQKTSTGTATVGQFYKLTKDVPNQYFGPGSDLALMANKFFQNNVFTSVYAFAYADPAAAGIAAGLLSFTGPATVAGELALMIAGKRVAVTIAAAQIATSIATAVTAAINADTSLPITAAVHGTNLYQVILTAKCGGVIGNDIDVRVNYYEGEVVPSGVVLTITAMTGGTGSIDLATLITALGTDWYQALACSATDATNLGLIEAELARRWGPLAMIDGMYVCAKRGTGVTRALKLQSLIDFGTGRNSKHVTCMGTSDIPNTSAEVASAYLGQLAYEGSIDPVRPFQTLELVGILPPVRGSRNEFADDNSLLYSGITTFDCLPGDKISIQRAITMYQTNAVGADDIAYLDVNTLLTLMFLRYDFRRQIRTRYPRARLANDNARMKPGLQVMTPNIGKAVAIEIFRGWEQEGYVENIDQFKRDLVCQRPSGDVQRLEWILPPNLVNQFIVGAAQLQFLLEDVVLA
jgi:phage tail sheath gpL-like